MFEDTIGIIMHRDDYGAHNTTVYKKGQREEFIGKLRRLYKAHNEAGESFSRYIQYVIGPAGDTDLAMEANGVTGGLDLRDACCD